MRKLCKLMLNVKMKLLLQNDVVNNHQVKCKHFYGGAHEARIIPFAMMEMMKDADKKPKLKDNLLTKDI